MKRIGIILMCLAALTVTACSALQGAGNNAVAMASGQSCGSAVQGLYKSYKSTGNLNITSGTNLPTALALATCYSQLKENKNDKQFRKSFINGMVASSAGLFTTASAGQFVDQMLSSNGLANVNSSNIAQTATTATTILSLLNTLK